MPDTYLSLEQLNVIFQNLTISMLGISFASDTDKTPYSLVRIAWQEEGAPAWEIDEDICFLQIMEADTQYNRQRDVVLTGLDSGWNVQQNTSYTRMMNVRWVFYGPNGFEHAQTIRDLLFYQENHDTLALSNIYLVPDIAAPQHTHELFDGRWWRRFDLICNFNELIIREIPIPYVQSAEITLEDDTGILDVLDITNP